MFLPQNYPHLEYFFHISSIKPKDLRGLPQILPKSAKFLPASMLAALAQYSISDLVLVSTIQDRKCCPNIRKYQIEFIKWEIWAWEMFTSSLTWNNIICYCIVCLYPVRCGMCWVCSSPGQPSPPGYCWAAFVVECYNVVHTRKVLVYKIE